MSRTERIAARVKEWRGRRGMSQEQLAQKAGLSRGFLSRLEVARQNPNLSTLEKIAKALKVDLAKLVI